MFKRGQVTVFVLVGIVLVVVLTVVFYFNREIFSQQAMLAKEESIVVSDDAKQVKGFLKDCLHEAGEQALVQVAAFSGFDELQTPSFSGETNYAYINGKMLLPSLDDVEHNLEKVAATKLEECTNDFKLFRNVDVAGRPEIAVEVKDEETNFYLSWKIDVYAGESKERIEQVNEVVETSLGEMYQVADSTVKNLASEKNAFCLSCLAELAKEKGVFPQVDQYDEDLLIRLMDTQHLIQGASLTYAFALKTELGESNA